MSSPGYKLVNTFLTIYTISNLCCAFQVTQFQSLCSAPCKFCWRSVVFYQCLAYSWHLACKLTIRVPHLSKIYFKNWMPTSKPVQNLAIFNLCSAILNCTNAKMRTKLCLCAVILLVMQHLKTFENYWWIFSLPRWNMFQSYCWKTCLIEIENLFWFFPRCLFETTCRSHTIKFYPTLDYN